MSRAPRLTLNAEHPQVLATLHRLLGEHGYGEAGLEPCGLTGTCQPMLPRDGDLATPRATLIRLFHLQMALPRREVVAAISPLSISDLADIGLLREHGRYVSSNVEIQSYGGLLLAVDRVEQYAHADVVMSVAASSVEVANVTVRNPVQDALDFGTGCGVQALLTSAHSERVFAVDLNPRAIEFTRFNCALNSIRNVACLQGDMLRPVKDRQFDLIITNPPFVISPFTHITFRDGGGLQDFCVVLARRASRLLREGGYLHMIYQWMQPPGDDWQHRLSKRFSGLGCDVWGLRILSQDPDSYIGDWTPSIYAGHPRKLDTLQSKWRRFFHDHNTDHIGTILLTLRKRGQRKNLAWFEDAPGERDHPYGSSISAGFELGEFVFKRSQTELLNTRFAVAPELAMVRRSRRVGAGWKTVGTDLCLESGMQYFFNDLEPSLLEAICACDGRRTLQQAFEATANGKVRHRSLRYLPQIRELVRHGFLHPVQRPS